MQSHHRRVLLVAIALGLLIAMLGFGRVQAAEPGWVRSPTETWQYQPSGRIDTTVDTAVDPAVFDVDAFSS